MRYRTYTRAQGVCTSLDKTTGVKATWTGVVGGGGGPFNSTTHFSTARGNTWNDLHDTSLDDRAIIAAKIKLKQADVNLGVAYAERNRTARLLGDTARRIGTAFKSLKRGDVRAAMRILRVSDANRRPRGNSIPQKWLELQYGWKPLLSDVYGAAAALSRQPLSDWRVTAKALKEQPMTYSANTSNISNGNSLSTCQVEDLTFVRIDALPGNELLGSLSSLGITNPLLIGWELVPFSFVVDWMLPIGNWLDSIDALLGYTNITVSKSSFVRAKWLDVGVNNSSSRYVWTNSFVGTQRVVELRRTPSFGVPMGFPRFKDPRSLGHMTNGLALLARAFGRR